jgi:sec-independent protein translocase protein TatB
LLLFRFPHYHGNMSFSETIFLFFLALVIFGPKKLPEIARQAGKLLAELRRASNEFRSQIEQEIAHIEVANAQKTLPPSRQPEGVVASRTLSPAPVQEAESALPSTPPAIEPAQVAGELPAAEAFSTPAESASADPVPVSTSQESHV